MLLTKVSNKNSLPAFITQYLLNWFGSNFTKIHFNFSKNLTTLPNGRRTYNNKSYKSVRVWAQVKDQDNNFLQDVNFTMIDPAIKGHLIRGISEGASRKHFVERSL